MLDRLSGEVGRPATKATSASGSDSEITAGLDSDWFGSFARPLLGKEPGVALHYIVGDDFPISTCAKYVSKTEASRRQPFAYFLRALIRSDHGEPFFLALMAGCEAQWWVDFQEQQRIGAGVQKLTNV